MDSCICQQQQGAEGAGEKLLEDGRNLDSDVLSLMQRCGSSQNIEYVMTAPTFNGRIHGAHAQALRLVLHKKRRLELQTPNLYGTIRIEAE